MTENQPAISVRGLTKKYGTKTAVDDISFDVEAGSVFAFLGTNGAGKSTTIGCLTTAIAFDAGTAEVSGYDVRSAGEGVRARIGVVFQESILDPLLTGRENLRVRARFYSADRAANEARINELADLIGLGELHRPPVRHVLRRPAPARRHCPRPAARTAHHLPRRTHCRPGSGQPRDRLVHDPRPPRPPRTDRLPHHALHGRNRGGGPGLHHRQRPDHRRRHPRAAAGGLQLRSILTITTADRAGLTAAGRGTGRHSGNRGRRRRAHWRGDRRNCPPDPGPPRVSRTGLRVPARHHG